MKLLKQVFSFGALACTAPVFAETLVVIPDTSAAYLYDGAGTRRDIGEEAPLALFKDGAFKEYRIESTSPSGFMCDKNCHETVQNLPVGRVTLRIFGKKTVSFLDIPLTGKWSGGCAQGDSQAEGEEESVRCTVHLDEMTAPIRVEVNPDIEVGTLMPLPEGGRAMIVKVDTDQNYVLVAGHELLGPGKTWLSFDPAHPLKHKGLTINNLYDGRANMPKLLSLGSEAAQYCADLGSDWYLPAAKELGLMTPKAMGKIAGLDRSGGDTTGYTWSSSQNGKGLTSDNPEKTLIFQAHAWNNSSGSMSSSRDIYECKWENSGYNCLDKKTRRYQVLCFRRLSI